MLLFTSSSSENTSTESGLSVDDLTMQQVVLIYMVLVALVKEPDIFKNLIYSKDMNP